MNSKQAKEIPLEDFMNKIGYNPVKQERNLLVYYSPFRQEKTPSFKVNLANNTFHDYGNGASGKIIELLINLYSDSVKEALARLDNMYGYQKQTSNKILSQPIRKKVIYKEKIKEIQVQKIEELQNPLLIQYLKSRCIDIKTAKLYLQDIYYLVDGQEYFSLGFKNNSNGFETRNSRFKGNLIKKDITTVGIKKNAPVFIFEGFMDFLSYLTWFNIQSLEKLGSVLVLNSNSLKARVIEELIKINPLKLVFILDNDKSGEDTKKAIMKALGIESVAQNKIYSEYNDFNEFLVENKKGI